MLTTKEVRGVQVRHPAREGKETSKDGTPRFRRKIGKIFKTVFSPDGLRVVGFIVRRPDLLWMFKRPERFLALDAMDVQDGFIVPAMGGASWDERAIKRLGVDWDSCILWEGIEVKTTDGASLGHVDDISFDERTGDLNSLFLDDGGVARGLVGFVEIPADLMIGYKKGILIVKPEAASLLPTGGLAGKAGEMTAKIGNEAKEGVAAAGKAAGKAVDKGTVGIGKAIGRVKRSVTGAVDSYREESGAEERAAAKKAKEEAEAKRAKAAQPAKAAQAAKSSATAKPSAKTSASASAKPAAKSSASTKSSSAAKTASKPKEDETKSIGAAVGDHMKAAGSMFSNFKKEYDKARKG